MVYVLDPEGSIYTSHGKSKTAAISEAVRKYDPLRPVIRASVLRDVWVQMLRRGYCLSVR